MKPDILATIPVVPARDLTTSVAFYARLGFAPVTQNDRYAIVARDGAEIHLALVAPDAEAAPCEATAYIRVSSADALFREFSKRGMRLDPPRERGWYVKELRVYDPDGNVLNFGEPIEDRTLQFEARR